MGDRCYMELTCRKADKALFEELGFTKQYEVEPPYVNCVTMVDQEASYGHFDDMPKHVVYFGTSGNGGSYDAEVYACDGETYMSKTTSDHSDRFLIQFTDEGEPKPDDVARVKEFIAHNKKVQAMLQVAVEKSRNLTDMSDTELANCINGISGITNEIRADYGERAVEHGSPDAGKDEDDYTDLKDALCNMMHYAHAQGLDFAGALSGAEMHFEAESCLTPGCMEDCDDGEGYDGYCGSCADKREGTVETPIIESLRGTARLLTASPAMRAFIEQIGRLIKDGECAECHSYEDENPECDEHEAFILENDDAVDCLQRLITEAREIVADTLSNS